MWHLCPMLLKSFLQDIKLLPSIIPMSYFLLPFFLPFQSNWFQNFPPKNGRPGETPSQLKLPPADSEEEPQPLVSCSSHMCPIRVHWHVKQSYKEYWRVKITITNLNFVKNYSQWNLVMLHPNFRSINQVFSFNYEPLNTYGTISKLNKTHGINIILLLLILPPWAWLSYYVVKIC